MANKIIRYLSTLIAICISLLITYYRFTRPELTETQLFLKLWKVELCLVLCIITGVVFKVKNK